MTDTGISSKEFPAFSRSVRAHWAPLLLEPISGSYERFVVGVAVVGAEGFHLELANALNRLKCLYSDDAAGAVYAIHLAAEHFRQDLSRRAIHALTEPNTAVSSVSIGECRQAEGNSLSEIAITWMRTLSSLYSDERDHRALMLSGSEEALDDAEERAAAIGDRLPSLILNYVGERRQSYTNFFSTDLREGRRRRLTGRSHEVLIDFSGSKLVANFGTLQAGSIVRSVNLIKRRLWDLKVERDREPGLAASRHHEMILQVPDPSDPQITTKQHANLNEAREALEEQADQEELRLRSLNTVAAIGDHVLQAEAA